MRALLNFWYLKMGFIGSASDIL